MNTLQAKLLLWVVSGLPEDVLAAQSKQPKGLIGRFIMKPLFTKGNADLNRFILDLLQLQSDDDVLEIGFGPGQLAKHIADGLQQGKLTGLDFSGTMLAEAQKLNQHTISTTAKWNSATDAVVPCLTTMPALIRSAPPIRSTFGNLSNNTWPKCIVY